MNFFSANFASAFLREWLDINKEGIHILYSWLLFFKFMNISERRRNSILKPCPFQTVKWASQLPVKEQKYVISSYVLSVPSIQV